MPKGIPKHKEFVEDFETAAQDMQMKGSYPPDEWADVEDEYHRTKKNLIEYIKALEAKSK